MKEVKRIHVFTLRGWVFRPTEEQKQILWSGNMPGVFEEQQGSQGSWSKVNEGEINRTWH